MTDLSIRSSKVVQKTISSLRPSNSKRLGLIRLRRDKKTSLMTLLQKRRMRFQTTRSLTVGSMMWRPNCSATSRREKSWTKLGPSSTPHKAESIRKPSQLTSRNRCLLVRCRRTCGRNNNITIMSIDFAVFNLNLTKMFNVDYANSVLN